MSEYKRLTKQVFDKVQGCEDKMTMHGQSLYDLYNRLAELEDKIESRKLVELKYKNGDYVFFISWLSGNVCEGTVVDWQEDSGYCIICGNDLISAYECFSTKEAAEERLKELQERRNEIGFNINTTEMG